MKVAKFGGTSLASASQILKVCEIVKHDPERRMIVVSAPGKREKGDIKVTDLLIRLAECRIGGVSAEAEMRAVVERYAEIQRELGLPLELLQEIERDLRSRVERVGANAGQFMDAVKAGGEDNCARLVAGALRKLGLDAHYVNPRDAGLLLSDDFGNAQVLPESYDNLRSLRDMKGIGVFPGFFGYTRAGAIATFPRGGSDISGAILAAAVKADVYENFTDVDSVFSVDPRIVPNPRPIPALTYREMRELSYAGFDVFHDEAIIPAVRAGIPICIKNTNRPDAPGTSIVPDRQEKPGEVAGIASSEGFCTIFISKYLMNREIGFGRHLLQILEEEGISYEHTPSGIDSTSVIVREKEFDADAERRVTQRIRNELSPDDVSVEHGLALVMIVGEGMRYTVGLAGRATGALARAGVNIEMINQGSSEISLMFGVKARDRRDAVKALYATFFGSSSLLA